MADHLTEEEQVEALKRWWNDNWLTLVAPILLLLVAYLVWNMWGDHKRGQAEAASSRYQELMMLLDTAPGETPSDENKLSAIDVANEILADYPGGMYANMSSLLLAKFAVEDGELEKAAGLIRQVVDEGANAAISDLAKTRLARVLSAQGKYEEALALVVTSEGSAYRSLMAEIRGDIFVAQGSLSLARTAYQEALDNLGMEQYARRGLVQVKLDNTALASNDAEITPVPESDEQGDA